MLCEYDSQTRMGFVFYMAIFKESEFEEAMREVLIFTKDYPIQQWVHNALFIKGTFTKAIPFLKNELIPQMEK